MPWKPSQPAMMSQLSVSLRPLRVKWIVGLLPARSSTRTASASNRIAPPAASRAAIRSFTTSCWP
jgi:hypothetical protein